MSLERGVVTASALCRRRMTIASREHCIDDIAYALRIAEAAAHCCFGGASAIALRQPTPSMVLGDLRHGNDLNEVSKIARAAICRWNAAEIPAKCQ